MPGLRKNRFPLEARLLHAFYLSCLLVLASCSAGEGEGGKSLKLPKPMQYSATPQDGLGVNENGKGLNIGQHVEDVIVQDIHGRDYPLSRAWAEKPALIVFYRGGWCPFCNAQVRELSLRYGDLDAAGVQPVLISVDTPDRAAVMEATYEVPFPVLSDPDLLAHRVFNVVLTPGRKTLWLYRLFGLVPSEWSGREHNSFAVASAFIIDKNGRVVVSHAPKDYKSRPSVDQLLGLIEASGLDR